MKPTKQHRKKLRLGMQVIAVDGQAGKVTRIITDPESRQPLYLVVKFGRPWHRREVTVPVSYVSGVGLETVNLNIQKDALEDFPDYEVTVVKGKYEKSGSFTHPQRIPLYDPPDNSGYMVLRQRSVPESSIAIERGMAVHDRAGQPVGSVEGLILDRGGRRGMYIVFRRSNFSRSQLIADDLVENVTSGGVKLRIEMEQIELLPEYTVRTIETEREG